MEPGRAARGRNILQLGLFMVFALLAFATFPLVLGVDTLFLSLLFLLFVASLVGAHFFESALPYFPIWALMFFAFMPLSLDDRVGGRAPLVYLVFVFPFAFLALGRMATGRRDPVGWSRRLSLAGLLLALTILFAVIRANDKEEALLYGAAWGLYGLVLLPGMVSLGLRIESTRVVSRIVAAVAMLCCLGVGKYFLTSDPSWYTNPIQSLDNNALIFLTAPVGILAFALLTQKATWWRALAFLIIAAQLVFSFSRTGLIGLGVGILVVTALAEGRTSRSRLTAWVAVVLLAAGAVVTDTTGAVKLHKLRYIGDAIPIWTGGGEVWLYDRHRQAMAQGAREVISEHLLLGTGLGRDNYLEALRRTSIYVPRGGHGYMVAHNLYLTYFAQLGLFGFLALLAFFTVIGLDLWRSHRHTKDPASRTLISGALAGHVTILVMFAGNEYIIAPFPWWFWGLALGMAYRALWLQLRRRQPAPAPATASSLPGPSREQLGLAGWARP